MYEDCPFDSQGRKWGEAIAESGMKDALVKVEARKDLQDRHEGKVGGDEEVGTKILNIVVGTEEGKKIFESLIGRERIKDKSD